jgi:hypothetical protein
VASLLSHVLNTAGLGKNTANDSGAVQKITLATGSMRRTFVLAAPAANGGPLLFDWGTNDRLGLCFNGSTFATTRVKGNVTNQIYPGGTSRSPRMVTRLALACCGRQLRRGNADNNPPTPVRYTPRCRQRRNATVESNMNADRDSLGNFAKFSHRS